MVDNGLESRGNLAAEPGERDGEHAFAVLLRQLQDRIDDALDPAGPAGVPVPVARMVDDDHGLAPVPQ